MDLALLRLLAQQLLDGSISTNELIDRVDAELSAGGGTRDQPTADLDEVRLDVDRANRCGFPEVIYGEGKLTETISKTAAALIEKGQDVLATRVNREQGTTLCRDFPQGIYNDSAKTFRIKVSDRPVEGGRVAVVTAGTSDLPIAEEALETLAWMRVETKLVRDVGVAGPHRLRERINQLEHADAIVVVAGMEGALPSVVGGYVRVPVIAVPTSVGYGANLGGLTAMLGMLNSCASNVTVVNIDAGFKGGYVSGLIATNIAKARNNRP